jgi:hypothetical protein
MKHTKLIWGLLAVFFFLAPVSVWPTERTAKYRIRVMGMNIGEFLVTQKTAKEEISIKAVTSVKVKIIFTYRINYIQETLHRNGSLCESHVQAIKDGKVNSDALLKKQGGSYLLVKDGDSTLIHDNICYSGSLLYFNEPSQVSSMYKERTGEKSNMKCIADHIYTMTNEKNHTTNEYEYKDGVLEHAALKHPLATIYLERILNK